MKKLILFTLAVATAFASFAQNRVVSGRVVTGNGAGLAGALVTVPGSSISVATDIDGVFKLEVPYGTSMLVTNSSGYNTSNINIATMLEGTNATEVGIGEIVMTSTDNQTEFFGEFEDLLFDEGMMEDEEGNSQAVAALTGANDDIYYNTASYNFGPMYFNYRGYDSSYQSVYINGLRFNDIIRGRFNFSSLLGMTSRAFRNKTSTVGINASAYGFGDLGGSVNYNTTTDLYAPGFNGSVALTNSNYMLRGMVTYASGLNKKGWAYTVSAIGRYANEGVMEGTFYNSGGLFLSAERVLDDNNALVLTAFGGPTQRATGGATYQEVYDLMGSNLYNPYWGWQDGKKRSSRITETFDPTVMLNWLYKKGNTQVNTGAAARWVHYNRSALQYYKANDPNPTYYRYLPSYYLDDEGNPTEQSEYYTWLWQHDPSVSQIDWDALYQINYLNNYANNTLPDSEKKGSSYILENRINNQFNFIFNTYVNTRINRYMTLQGGIDFNYTKSTNYKTIRDLLGGEFWLDVDPFSDRDITIAPDNLQNDLDNPNRRVTKGDRFGYDYDINAIQASAWLQNMITLPKWDLNYAMRLSYTQFQRDGHMRNGRAPHNSLGKSDMLRFDNGSIKLGATYKINGRNQILAHAEYGTRAPLPDNIFIAPRVKNTTISNPESQRDLAIDGSYVWNYRRFRGAVTGFYTMMDNVVERTGFYDDNYNTYAIFALEGVKKVYQGVEIGMSYKITPSITATFAGTYSRFQYKNNPQGTRSFENGLYADTTQTVYLKNFYVGSTPQTQCNLGIDYAAPKNWFFNINATWQGDAYVNLSPAYHEAMPGLAEAFPSYDEAQLFDKIKELCSQDKLKDAFTLNLSIGKAIYMRKCSLNFNLNINNVLNNRNVVTYAYQQGRLDTKTYNHDKYPNRYQYAQGIRLFLNIGVRF